MPFATHGRDPALDNGPPATHGLRSTTGSRPHVLDLADEVFSIGEPVAVWGRRQMAKKKGERCVVHSPSRRVSHAAC